MSLVRTRPSLATGDFDGWVAEAEAGVIAARFRSLAEDDDDDEAGAGVFAAGAGVGAGAGAGAGAASLLTGAGEEGLPLAPRSLCDS